ncbi:prepilin-type N-terminal cleavage/methylation domain-containing protein [Vibrio sp. Sgm 22]|uniref:prepilin-type N-terminal cleavage/methylation domain-containing protein n=1 Tax=unclassified Vibrio TaxID=2614977 RepID=UPI002248A7CB|nr:MULTISPECIES: prepilin-type N-terminal cleavage/methylation domain-containing protein [unclassified Vibrio]MCX2760050.1 prepilin-type N-terminal cleavage/methylation domain-containing protein [Vibrio sp. 14G-20]MCX2777038.1 prepilin-type N-terminal cleavage/methylation domain-containing protein [Vibrio sp. Sgm 22]
MTQKNSKGFTLIELVVVIVVLGVLAVTAAPKFLNLQTDAKEAVLIETKGALNGGIAIAYGKLAVNGLEKGPYSGAPSGLDPNYPDLTDIFPNCTMGQCAFMDGYPDATREALAVVISGVGDGEDLNFADFDSPLIEVDGKLAMQIAITDAKNVSQGKLVNNKCYLQYLSFVERGIEPMIAFESCE